MANRNKLRSRGRVQRGFSLAEVLIALTVITIVSFMVIGAVGPWLSLKQSIDNDRQLTDIRQALTAKYDANGMAAEAQKVNEFFKFTTSVISGAGYCNLQADAFSSLSTLVSDAGAQAANDGYGNPWCVFLSGQLQEARDGTIVYYRNIAIVSAGLDGVLAPTTRMTPTGTMTFAGDDIGVVISGFDIQYPKLKETLRRLSRVANIYESYFSARYMSYADRDITRNYFVKSYDADGAIPSTEGNWAQVDLRLNAIGVSPSEAYSPWEKNSQFIFGNHNESMNGSQVRSPASTGTGVLPYTSIIAARVPAPEGVDLYVTRVAVGNY